MKTPRGKAIIQKYHKTERGKAALKKAINKKIDEGYYRFGKGAISRLRQSAKKRDIEFKLTVDGFEQWWHATEDKCEYCGISQEDFVKIRDFVVLYSGKDFNIIKFKRFFKTGQQKAIRWMTIDRANNSKGYQIDNIVKSCWICNSLKSDFFNSSQMKQIAPEMIGQLLTKARN